MIYTLDSQTATIFAGRFVGHHVLVKQAEKMAVLVKLPMSKLCHRQGNAGPCLQLNIWPDWVGRFSKLKMSNPNSVSIAKGCLLQAQLPPCCEDVRNDRVLWG